LHRLVPQDRWIQLFLQVQAHRSLPDPRMIRSLRKIPARRTLPSLRRVLLVQLHLMNLTGLGLRSLPDLQLDLYRR